MKDLQIFNRIINLNSLKPSKKTNSAFFDLVEFCKNNSDTNLNSSQVQKLRKLSSIAEYEMELYWANRILSSKNPARELKQFWYYKNYEQLMDLEYVNAKQVKGSLKNILFVGGGSLPLTSILLSQKHGATCTILEKDSHSHNISAQLVKKLGLNNNINILNISGESYSHYNRFDMVYVAALVGTDDQSKEKIITNIYKNAKKGALLLCRSSHGARKLLYIPVARALIKKIQPVLEIKPYNSIINSFFILQKT